MNPDPLDYSHLALLLLLQAPLVTIPGQFKSGTSTSTKLGDTPTGQSKCVGWKRTLLAWCTMRLARPMLCLSQVQTLSLSLSKPLKTWNWTKWRAESSRKLLPLLRPQCELVSILFNYQKMTVHCQLPSYVVLYLLNSVVIAKDM